MMNEEQKARLDKSLNDISLLCIAIPKTDVYEREYDDGFSHARMISSDVLQDIKNGVKSKGAVKAYEMTAGADFNKDYFYYNISEEYVSKVKEACENIPADKLNDGLQFVESAVESAKIGHAVDNALFNDDLMNSVAANKYGLDFTDLKFSTDDLRAESQSKSADVKNPVLNRNDRFYENYIREVTACTIHNDLDIAVPTNKDGSLNYNEAMFVNKEQLKSVQNAMSRNLVINDDRLSALKNQINKYGKENIVFQPVSKNIDADLGRYVCEEIDNDFEQYMILTNEFSHTGCYLKSGIGRNLGMSTPESLKFTKENYTKWVGLDDPCVDFKIYLSKDQPFGKDAVIKETKSSDRIYGTGKRGDEFADFDNNIQTEQSMSY